jgi:hypothetical protein
MPCYSWNTAKVAIKHQTINQTLFSIISLSWYVKILSDRPNILNKLPIVMLAKLRIKKCNFM